MQNYHTLSVVRYNNKNNNKIWKKNIIHILKNLKLLNLINL